VLPALAPQAVVRTVAEVVVEALLMQAMVLAPLEASWMTRT